jgi:hypothetical protein
MGLLDYTPPDKIDLQTLYHAVLGYRAFPYFPQKEEGFPAKDKFTVPPASANNTPGAFKQVPLPVQANNNNPRSVFGTPYFMPVLFVNVGKNKETIYLPNEPIMSVRMQKHIVKTAVAGSGAKSSVKELTGFEDVKISIDGIAINETNTEQWPETELKNLRTLYEQRTSLYIRCSLLKSLAVTKVCIEDLDIKPISGHQGAFQYTMALVSDEDYAYQLLNR